MRILAVAETLHLVEIEEKFLGKTGLTAHVLGYVAVVECGVRVGLGRQTETGLRQCVTVGSYFLCHSRVVVGVADHGDALAVLRRGAEHGRSAYVDVFDGVGEGHTLLGHGGLEGVQIHYHHVDQADAVVGELFHVVYVITASEQGAVNLGVECLHATSADFRKTCDLADACHGQSALQQHLHGASGGDDLPSHILEGCGELHNASFIANAY